jgi:hypothetical protein
MKVNLAEIGRRIQAFFTVNVEEIARKSGFVQRVSKLTGVKFLQAIVFSSLEQKRMTLSSLGQSCLELGVTISEQGLDERIGASSVAFLGEMASQALAELRQEEALGIQLLQQFGNIYLVDSSQISLPATMSELFPGSGGNAGPASMKVQLVFDYLHGQFAKLELCRGREPDQGYRGHWSLRAEGALFIFDLGYFVLDTFKHIHDHQGYFLSRLQLQTALLDGNGQRLELSRLLAHQQVSRAEYEVLIGNRPQHQLPCRLVALRLAQEAADRQRQKAKENARRHGRSVTKAHLQLLDWACFITNVPATMLRSEHIAPLYRIRWQIELVFKLCKSYAGLDSITALRPERVLTDFYARLIGLILTYFLIAPVRLPWAHTPKREISPIKVRLIFQRFARTWALTLHDLDAFIAQLHDFFHHVKHFGFKQKRSQSPNTLYALALLSACYEWDPNDFSALAFNDSPALFA